LGAKLKLAFDYLCRTDFSQTPDGRYELDADGTFALVQRYRPKPSTAATWEAHRQYTDVQYVVEGTERMGYAPLNDRLAVCQAYDAESDVVFYNAEGSFFDVPAGSFVIFTPHDVHAPGLASDLAEHSKEVCKVVVKCRIRSWVLGFRSWVLGLGS